MTQSSPIVNQRIVYVNNMQVSWTSNTTLTIAAGGCSDSNNIIDIELGSATVLNAAVNGANGLDSGTFAASTWYYVFAIADSNNNVPVATILSTSATTPYLPAGYDSIRRIGSVLTDGSAHFLKFYTTGNSSTRRVIWDATIQVLNAGAATSYTAFSLAAAVPPIAATYVGAEVSVLSSGAGATGNASFRPTGSSATSVRTITAAVASVAQVEIFPLYCVISAGAPKVDYLVASGSVSVGVTDFEDYL